MTDKKYTAEVQFTGYMDVNRSPYEGVTKSEVEKSIDEMDERELKRWMKRNFDAVLTSFENNK